MSIRYEAVYEIDKDIAYIKEENSESTAPPEYVAFRHSLSDLGEVTSFIEEEGFHLATDWTRSSIGVTPTWYVTVKRVW
jgi:hypothetical protein